MNTRDLLVCLLLAGLGLPGMGEGGPPEATCLYVSSYHVGYHWNDGIEAGLEPTLAGVCRLERFYMDTLRHKGADHARARGVEAKALIDRLAPAVVIACDDAASQYLVQPFLREVATPVVFCGVNWSVEPYGYPYPNLTGMIEVAPQEPLLRQGKELVPGARRVLFLSADVPTQHKERERLEQVARRLGLELESRLVTSLEEWRAGFAAGQVDHDLVVLGNPSGIRGWDEGEARRVVDGGTRRLTLSFGVLMSRHAILSLVNVPQEQGEWAGAAAREILKGTPPSAIPIVPNQRWRILARPTLAAAAGIPLPEPILRQAERVE